MRLFRLSLCFFILFLVLGCERATDAPADQKPAPTAEGQTAAATTEETSNFKEISYKSVKQRVPVLMYHDVVEKRDKNAVWFDFTVKEFEEQVLWMEEHKLQPISLDQLYEHLNKGTELPENAIVLTFDDNYQGFYDYAYPLLKARNWPCAMFVHTQFVGDLNGHKKMTWDTLKLLVSEKLVTIGSHTVSHPADITLLTPDEQMKELKDSKKALEENLSIKVDYLAYPDGKNGPTTQLSAQESGYKLAFSTASGFAEESPTIFSVNRYIANKLEKAWEQREETLTSAPCDIFDAHIKDGPVEYEFKDVSAIKLALITGGVPTSRRTFEGRQSVGDFIIQNQAAAGINGTFFAMAAVAGTSNEMIGPIQTESSPDFVADTYPERLAIIRNRPLVIWDAQRFMIVPYSNERMNSGDGIKEILPTYSNCFVAGAWLVHKGVAQNEDQLLAFGPKDLMDPRRRVFVGIKLDGTMVFGASLGSVSSEKLGQAAAAAGVAEAVLLDSGFSTSLVYGSKVIASGHSTPTEPSRPVPHAILLMGKLAQNPDEINVPQPAKRSGRKGRRR